VGRAAARKPPVAGAAHLVGGTTAAGRVGIAHLAGVAAGAVGAACQPPVDG
jgi:hypothetical protein